MKQLGTVVVLLFVLVLAGCAPAGPEVDVAAEEAAIRKADIAWAKTGEMKDLEAQMEFYTDDPIPIMMPPNGPKAVGKEAILEAFRPMYDRPDLAVTWRPGKVEVARSGDIGYVLGTYEMTMNDPEGNPRTDKGKYIELWKKQADGSWKVAADIFNSDLPAPGAE